MTKIKSIVFEHFDLQELMEKNPIIPRVDYDNAPGYAGYRSHLNEETLSEWLDRNFKSIDYTIHFKEVLK